MLEGATIEFQCILCYDYRGAEWTKRRVYAVSSGAVTDDSLVSSEGYGLISNFYPYIELVKKSNQKSELRLRLHGELVEFSVYNSTSLHCSRFKVCTFNRRLNLTMKHTYGRNSYDYSGYYYLGNMKGYATISTSSNLESSKLKKFKTMLGQGSLSMGIVSTDGAYLEHGISSAERNNWLKLVKQYQTLVKQFYR